MRKRKTPRPYLQIIAVLLMLMSISRGTAEKIQGTTVAILAPAWEQLNHIRGALKHVTNITVSDEDGTVVYAKEEIRRLKLENQLLSNEVDKLQEILQQEESLASHVTEEMKPLIQQHRDDINHVLSLQLLSIPAQVIFRSPSSWNSSLWINVGAHTNHELGREVIAKNSPVVLGIAVVGVIDYVGNNQSRVRLISDSGLNPSVRAIRVHEGKTWYLAKGELRGSIKPLWRKQSQLLKGVGFNYDFPDEEGPARDLRTGEAIGTPKISIIQPGDLLVTTGMDGVFPPGLEVAEVTHIDLLKEGDYYYELEATPSVKQLDDLSIVYVIPAISRRD